MEVLITQLKEWFTDNLRIFVPKSKINGDIIKNYATNEVGAVRVYKEPSPFVMVKEFKERL